MHSKGLFALTSLLFFGLAGPMSAPASAGLVGNGTNTVSANFWIPSPIVPPPACDDRAWARCATRIGAHADGGPPAPPPASTVEPEGEGD